MKKTLIIASCLLTAGILVCFAAIALIDFDFRKLDNNMYITNTYEFTEKINKVYIDTSNADIEVLPSDDDTAKIVCFEHEKSTHAVTLSNETLKIERESQKWYENFNFFNFCTQKITLYLPQKDAFLFEKHYSSLNINCTTGYVDISDINHFADINIDITTGDTKLNNVHTVNLNIKSTTGKINLNEVTSTKTELKSTTGKVTLKDTFAHNLIEIKVTTGDITFENCDASTLNCKTTTGDIKGTLLSNKIFYTDTTTGDVQVPHSTEGGLCELKTTTGSIKISVMFK